MSLSSNTPFKSATCFAVELFVELLQGYLIGSLRATRLLYAGKEALVDNHTGQRGIGLQAKHPSRRQPYHRRLHEELLFRRRIALALRRNFTDHDIARCDTRTDTYNTVCVEILRCVFAYVGDVVGKLFHTTLRFTHFERELIHVNRSQGYPHVQYARSIR